MQELGSLLSKTAYYNSVTETELIKDIKEFVSNYAKESGELLVEKTKTSRKLLILKAAARKKNVLEQVEESTRSYFAFIDVIIKFISDSKHLSELHLSEKLITTAIEELLNYWLKQSVIPNTQNFTLEMIEAMCKLVLDLATKHRIFIMTTF